MGDYSILLSRWLAGWYYIMNMHKSQKISSWTLEAVGNDHFHMNYSDCIVLTRPGWTRSGQANLFLIDIEHVLAGLQQNASHATGGPIKS